jgi:RNA polymerase sigma factor (sigma-70 family)
MPGEALAQVARSLRRGALLHAGTALTDGQLLERFVLQGDEAAFELLVRRHGPMVLGVCRRVLGHVHDAEDAFQAVFLVLARKAASVRPRDLVANWLHGVAHRTALDTRARLCRRRNRERQVEHMPQPTVIPDLEGPELHRILDEELCKLPDKYRSPIVLCDLEGRSRKEAARQLHLVEGTLSSRLATARKALARRLTRRGLGQSAGVLAAALAGTAASAAVPAAMLHSTVKAAALIAAGKALADFVSAPVLAISQGVMKTMLLNKMKIVPVLVLGMVIGGWTVGLVGLPGARGEPALHAAPDPTGEPSSRNARSDEEPLDADLLLDQRVQKELRLSKNQVQKLHEVVKGADRKNEKNQESIRQMETTIKQLQQKIHDVRERISQDRTQAMRQAAPGILSARAVQRLREIQRQRRGLEGLLQDPRVQRALKLDDEQEMAIGKVLKEAKHKGYTYYMLDSRIRDGKDSWLGAELVPAHLYEAINLVGFAPETRKKLLQVLTPQQKRILQTLIGTPAPAAGGAAILEEEKAEEGRAKPK